MQIVEINTEKKTEVRKFIEFPFSLYKDCPQWVPPLRKDAKGVMDRKRHPFYKNSDASFFIATNKIGELIGRMAMIENKQYNARNGKKCAFFYLFDVINEFSIAEALFEKGYEWAKERGLNEIYGPKGFAALNGLGMLTRGFDHRPAFGIPYNYDYYPTFLDKLGFKKDRELLSGYLNREHVVPEKIRKIAEKVKDRWGVNAEQYNTRRELRKMVPYLKDLYNGSLVESSGNAPLSDDDVSAMASQIIWFADPKIIKILMQDDKAVGFLLAYPDISAALQKANGRLWPLGWLFILAELRKTKWININGAGIINEFRGLGGTAVLFDEIANSIKSGHYEHADLVQIGVENEKMQRELSSIGIDFYKSHCIYRKII